jgi:hypothetical protein
MDRNLFEWEMGESDRWDDRGHFTVDAGEFAITTPMADAIYPWFLAVMDVFQGIADADVDDNWECMAGAILAGVIEHADSCGVPVDFIFDNDDEFDSFFSDMVENALTANDYKRTDKEVYDIVVDYLDRVIE